MVSNVDQPLTVWPIQFSQLNVPPWVLCDNMRFGAPIKQRTLSAWMLDLNIHASQEAQHKWGTGNCWSSAQDRWLSSSWYDYRLTTMPSRPRSILLLSNTQDPLRGPSWSWCVHCLHKEQSCKWLCSSRKSYSFSEPQHPTYWWQSTSQPRSRTKEKKYWYGHWSPFSK